MKSLELDLVLKFIMMPFLSAQLLLMVLIYFTIVRKRISTLYKWYFCFFSSIIFFLIGKASQQLVDYEIASYILYARVAMLFAIGMPSLVIASAIYTDVRKSLTLYLIPYLCGIAFAASYIISLDSQRQLLFSTDTATFLSNVINTPHYLIQLYAVWCLSIIPCGYFFVKALFNGKNSKDIVVLLGGLIFGLLFAAGSTWGTIYWIYYVGSIVPAVCWTWVIFHDVNEMKGKVGLLKDELYDLAHSGQQLSGGEVDKLLSKIEQLSSNNLIIYKMRLKEILSRLTDKTIEAGGNSDRLLTRYSEQEKVLAEVEDADELRKIARDEVVGLSQIISDMPNQRIESIKNYLTEYYHEDIDINQLANRFSVSRSYLMREFKKVTHLTVNQFLTNHRIDVAKTLLKTQSVTDTAFAVGFNNSNYFSTVFKKITGQTPGQYQQSLTKN